jgi:hypothetical protein
VKTLDDPSFSFSKKSSRIAVRGAVFFFYLRQVMREKKAAEKQQKVFVAKTLNEEMDLSF